MNAIVVSAPGKIVLSGEYAVLFGAHAIAASVSRRARVTLERCAQPGIEVRAPGFSTHPARYSVGADGQLLHGKSADATANLGLFELAWQACSMPIGTGLIITLDTTEFVEPGNGRKLGLGSSAALTVALVATLCPDRDRREIAALARTVHHEFQRGGSGVDIACSTHGGIIDYTVDAGVTNGLVVPQGLHLAILWSGQPANTAARIHSLNAALQDPQQHATLHELQRHADAFAGCWHAADPAPLYRQLADYITALREFDADQGLGIFDGGHAALTEAARAAGLLYKPCGAGGGDVGAAFALDESLLRAFVKRAVDYGFAVLDLELGADGMRRDGRRHDG